MKSVAYNAGLDALRALAISSVIAQHSGVALVNGRRGVTLFFVISGYLITTQLVRELKGTGTILMARFYFRRLVRLAPALLVTVLATVLWLLAMHVQFSTYWLGLLSAMTYTTPLVEWFLGSNGVSVCFQWSWSLGVEELFYLMWPLLLVVAARLRLSWGIGVSALAVGIAVSWLWRTTEVFRPSDGFSFSPPANADALLLGALIAFISLRFGDSRRLRAFASATGPIGLVGLLAMITSVLPDPNFVFDYEGAGRTAIASALLILWFVACPANPVARLFSRPPIPLIGQLSYSLYLLNLLSMLIVGTLAQRLPAGPWWFVVWASGLASGAYLLWRFVETPVRRRWAGRVQTGYASQPNRAGQAAHPAGHTRRVEAAKPAALG